MIISKKNSLRILLLIVLCCFSKVSVSQTASDGAGEILDLMPAIIAASKQNGQTPPSISPVPPAIELGDFRIFKVNVIDRSSPSPTFFNETIVTFDSQNRPFRSTVKFLIGPLAPRTNVSTSTYNDLGNIESTEAIVDVNGRADIFPKQFSYDTQARLVKTTQTNPDGSLSIVEFGYSNNGRLSNARISSSINGPDRIEEEHTFSYDSAGRIKSNRIVGPLISELNHEHAYDSGGNLRETVILGLNSRTVITRLPRVGNKQIHQSVTDLGNGNVQRSDVEYFYEPGACERVLEQNHPRVVAAAIVGQPHSLDLGCVKR